MSDESYWDNETRCPYCGAKGAQTTVLPAHRREWAVNNETTVEHFGEGAKDRKCNNCDHEWTDYSTLDRTP